MFFSKGSINWVLLYQNLFLSEFMYSKLYQNLLNKSFRSLTFIDYICSVEALEQVEKCDIKQ